MIKFINLNQGAPYLKFKKKYNEALLEKQKSIEAISISSYSKDTNEVNARFVNLKFVNKNEFIFFSNYESSKSKDFKNHSQITALIYWNSISTQIRLKAFIKKTTKEFNNNYFLNRSGKKNALAISSRQSKPIKSYEKVVENYKKTLDAGNLKNCPEYWGGYSFTPYYFEFWEGHESRLNRRDIYELRKDNWEQYIIQP
tara:strand:+ start:302 stop:898 length:597 start_codon:yes stop_codon:yes gene_type:complete